MKSLVTSALCALALNAAVGHAAEVTQTSQRPMPWPIPAVQNYAQVCLENQAGHALVLRTSWVGEQTLSVLPAGGQHVFRFEATGSIVPGYETKPFSVEFRRRGLFTRFDSAVVDAARGYATSNDCDDMPTYRFVYAQTGTGTFLILAPK